MANARSGSIIVVDTDASVLESGLTVKGVKVVGGSAAGTASISCNGVKIYDFPSIAINSSAPLDEIGQYFRTAITVNLTGAGTKVYIYCE